MDDPVTEHPIRNVVALAIALAVVALLIGAVLGFAILASVEAVLSFRS